MIKFEKKFLYTFANVEEAKKLIGKKGLFRNYTITEEDLIGKSLHTLESISPQNFPFTGSDSFNYQFFYYDPNLECKRAFLMGCIIQRKNDHNYWFDDFNPKWNVNCEYRIKEETKGKIILTNRQVAEWLAKGNGQVNRAGFCTNELTYDSNRDDEFCQWEIRKWHDTKWHIATKEYIEG